MALSEKFKKKELWNSIGITPAGLWLKGISIFVASSAVDAFDEKGVSVEAIEFADEIHDAFIDRFIDSRKTILYKQVMLMDEFLCPYCGNTNIGCKGLQSPPKGFRGGHYECQTCDKEIRIIT